VATVACWCGDLEDAEDAVQEALLRAIGGWRDRQRPDNAAGWLVTVARRWVLDRRRHDQVRQKAAPELEWLERDRVQSSAHPATSLTDDVLRMLLGCADARLSTEAQTVLALRYVAGLGIPEIARAFVCSESALEQRLVRAKRAARDLGVRFDAPEPAHLAERLPAIHLTILLIFNEGYSATQGPALLSNDACDEAIFLTEQLLPLVPDSAETLGLLALMKLQAARADARVSSDGALVRLQDQDRSRWNTKYVDEAFLLLARARATGHAPGLYELQAAIALHHAHAASFAETDWPAIVGLYDCLARIQLDVVTRLNRAIAISMAEGAANGLALVEALSDEEDTYPLVAAVRGDMLYRLGRFGEAALAFEKASGATQNLVERAFLENRIAECGQHE
jgi:RNA polymerase sigma factor (sigma-70 family)